MALRDAPFGMTAHVVYPAWDSAHCATLSPIVVEQVIRGRIGFAGVLMSDDIAMAALSGPVGERGRAALAAGCDLVLHCSGQIEGNTEIAGALDPISEAARGRLDRAMDRIAGKSSAQDFAALAAKRDSLLAYA